LILPCPILIDDDCSLGFAYIAVSQNFDQVKWLIAVFMIEKLIYATHWTKWILITKLHDKKIKWPEYFMDLCINDDVLLFSVCFISNKRYKILKKISKYLILQTKVPSTGNPYILLLQKTGRTS
jgi:hypothetical protein